MQATPNGTFMIHTARTSIYVVAGLLIAVASSATQPPSVIDAVDKGHAVGREQVGIEAVRAALAAGGDVNERGPHGWTPLMDAALQCRAGIVSLLLKRGADPNLRTSGGQAGSLIQGDETALMIASDCFIARRRAALGPERHMSAAYGEYELVAPRKMVGDLIAHGANVNAADANGRTAIMLAAMQGWVEVVRELLDANANINARDHEGRLAIDYADPENRELIGLLKKVGSDLPSGHSGRTVCDAERTLCKLGYGTPIMDCFAGRQFRAELARFQEDHSLKLTGKLDSGTLKVPGIR
jgi:ankyrin repeat protein